jgi:AraC-like DNA-binding protein
MIIPEEELVQYLGKGLEGLKDQVAESTIKKLRDYQAGRRPYPVCPAIDYLFLEHQGSGRSLRDLAKEIGISDMTLAKAFRAYGLPSLTQAEGVRKELGRS